MSLNHEKKSSKLHHKAKAISSLADAVKVLANKKDHHEVYGALVAIRTKFIKERDGVPKFRQLGGISKILSILKSTKAKLLDVALSILGNCALEVKTRTQILSVNGICVIGNVLKNVQQESIQNRACRTLANLAQDPQCCKVIHNDGVQESETGKTAPKKCLYATEEEKPTIIECMVDFLEKTESSDCQQTAVRAIRLLADTTEHINSILECQGFKIICKCMKSKEKYVLNSTLKAVGHFMQGVTKESIVWQFVNGEGPASLIQLTSHTDQDIAEVASSLLLSFVKQQMLRPCLGNAGAIDYFIQASNCNDNSVKERIPYVNALCLFCHEVVNRVRIRNGNGLELFLSCLKDNNYFLIHYRIISSLVCFLYDDPSMEILIQNKIVLVLIDHLQKCSQLNGVDLCDMLLTYQGSDHVEGQQCKESLYGGKESIDSTMDVTPWHSNTRKEKKLFRGKAYDSERYVDFKEIDCKEFGEKIEGKYDNGVIDDVASVGEASGSQGNSSNKSSECLTQNTEELADHSDILKRRKIKAFTKSASEPIFYANEQEINRTTDIKLSDDDELTLKKPTSKYSIDSPTYREISEWSFETSTAPRNIFEAQSSSQRRGSISPDIYYPYHSPVHSSLYSPLSTSSYASPSWSMGSSPRRCTSPTWSDSLYTSSPPNSPGDSNPSGLSPSDEWSPPSEQTSTSRSIGGHSKVGVERSLFSPPTSRPLSPLSLAFSPESPDNKEDLWWGNLSYQKSNMSDVELVYSEEEDEVGDDDDITLTETSDDKKELELKVMSHSCSKESGRIKNELPDFDEKINVNFPIDVDVENDDDDGSLSKDLRFFTSQDSDTSYSIPLHADPVYSHTMEATDFGKALQGESLARMISMESVDTSSSQTDCKSKQLNSNAVLSSNELHGTLKRKRTDFSECKRPKTKKRHVQSASFVDRLMDQCAKSITNNEEKLKSTETEKVENEHNRKESKSEKYETARKTTENNILVILSRLSYMDEQCTHLLSENVLDTLILYVILADKPIQRAERMLLRLAKNPKCLEGLLLNLLPVKFDIIVSCLKKHSHCMEKCTRNNTVADEEFADSPMSEDSTLESESSKRISSKDIEKLHLNVDCLELFSDLLLAVSMVVMSRYGKGVVQHMLLGGTQDEKIACCLSLPVVCREENFLRCCVIENGGLNSLITVLLKLPYEMKNLLYLTHSLHRIALIGDLTLLRNGVGISSKSAIFQCYLDHNRGKYNRRPGGIDNVSKDTTPKIKESSSCDLVVFVLDSGETIEAERAVLSSESNVFSAMLEGHYSERDQKEIHIPQINYKPFLITLQLIQGNRTKFDNTFQRCFLGTDEYLKRESFEILLEVLELCNQYLLSDLKQDISNVLFNKLVVEGNVVRVLHFSMRHNCMLLAKRCVSYIMLQKVNLSQRFIWIKEMVETTELKELTLLVKDVFESHMPTKMQICKI